MTMRFKTKYYLALLITGFYSSLVATETIKVEPLPACLIPSKIAVSNRDYAEIESCLGWVGNPAIPLCHGMYREAAIQEIVDKGEVDIQADSVAFAEEGRSVLKGSVRVAETNRIVSADTAYLYRDAKTQKITRIELVGQVRYQEPGRFMIAKTALINPNDKSGTIHDVLYRFYTPRSAAILPAIGQAKRIERFPNEDYLLENATYSTCPPMDRAWLLKARKITINKATGRGVARDTTLYIGKVPVFYSPYFSFPASKQRKSGFLMPVGGYTTNGGAYLSLPFYWNMAPNYDATLTPHLYSKRGLMMEGEFRYLEPHTSGIFYGAFLGHDRAFQSFIQNNSILYPQLGGQSDNRYALRWHNTTNFASNLGLAINFEQVSDDYYFQDLTNSLSLITQRQLLKEGVLTYTLPHWLFRGMVQGYQTLNPIINETPIAGIYQRLPQLLAEGHYENLPFNANFDLLGEYDQYDWPGIQHSMPEGPRFFVNPVLSFPFERTWGHLTPTVQLIQRYYSVSPMNDWQQRSFSQAIPRFSLDGGLVFERPVSFFQHPLTQTFEPHLFYLNVPYTNQTAIPVYDSAYMIFTADQLFRTNRFSGFDRIGDSNHLAYAFTTRWVSGETGNEIGNFTLGQIRYFRDRNVTLCQSPTGFCHENPLSLGYLSPVSKYSPIASSALYRFNASWFVTGAYVWDPATSSTNNSNINFHYQSVNDRTLTLGYSYLVNGDITQTAITFPQISPLYQAAIGFSWPLTEKISSLGAYGYNVSKNYEMMSFLGLQYNSCCWATRLVVGRTFKSLSSNARPEYATGVFLQILLKGLGTIENKNPNTILNTYIPGFVGAL